MKDNQELLGLKNTSQLANIWRAIKDSVTKQPPAYNMNGLVSENRWAWIKNNIASIWRSRFEPYPYYAYPQGNNGIFKITKSPDEPVVLAVLADWASDTPECRLIAAQAGIQDYSIHLGDTYYVGSSQEMAANFDTDHSGTWPYGNLGSFAIPGNHEMYSGGNSYFTELLPFMGLYLPGQEMPSQVQQASFFCLENDYWRIIGLDTGYDSLIGVFGITPNLNLELPPEQQDWLTNTVKLNEDQRGLIFMSHHQSFSAFEDEFPNPAKFVSSLLDPARDILWLWGHEHWFAIYGPNQMDNGRNIYGRCIGNSGMPVELNDSDGGIHKPKADASNAPENRNLVIYDQRKREIVDQNVPLGHNGYVQLTLAANNACIAYFDDNGGSGKGRLILEEAWSVNNGKMIGTNIIDHTIPLPDDMQHLSLFGDNLTDAINPPHSKITNP